MLDAPNNDLPARVCRFDAGRSVIAVAAQGEPKWPMAKTGKIAESFEPVGCELVSTYSAK